MFPSTKTNQNLQSKTNMKLEFDTEDQVLFQSVVTLMLELSKKICKKNMTENNICKKKFVQVNITIFYRFFDIFNSIIVF